MRRARMVVLSWVVGLGLVAGCQLVPTASGELLVRNADPLAGVTLNGSTARARLTREAEVVGAWEFTSELAVEVRAGSYLLEVWTANPPGVVVCSDHGGAPGDGPCSEPEAETARCRAELLIRPAERAVFTYHGGYDEECTLEPAGG